MVKYAETGFTRSYYGIGSEASSENKKNSRRSKQNSIESMSRSICEIYGFGQETSGGYWKLPLHKARVHMCIQELVHEYEQVMNTARTRSPRSDLCWEEQKTYQSWGKRGRSPRLSGAFKLMQRPRVMQKTTAAAELWDWRREEDEEEGHEGKKRNDPSGLFIRQRTCVRRGNQGTADFGSRAVTSVIANLLNKKISWMFSLWQMMSRRFTANREDDVTAVQQLQEDVEDEDFC